MSSRYLVERVILHKGCIGVEVDRLRRAGCRRALGFDFKRMIRAQSVSDVDRALHEGRVVLDEILVDPSGRDDVVGDVVQDRQIRSRLEHDRDVGEIGASVREGGEHRHLHMRMAQSPVGKPRPQDRMHLGHVRAPQHERIRRLEIIVAAHRLVHAEGAHEGDRGRRHAVAGIRIEVVGAKAGPHQLGGGVAFVDRPLPRAEHAERGRTLLLQHRLGAGRHHIEGFVPRHRRQFAVLCEGATLLAQQRRGQAVAAIHDLGEEIALDAVQPAIDLGQCVAVGGDDLACLDAHHHPASGAAEAARRLRPFDLQRSDAARHRLRDRGNGDAGGRRGDGCGLRLQQFASRE